MPPHCDALDGPVVKAAGIALARRDVSLVLPYVKADGEEEVREAFDLVRPIIETNGPGRKVAELYFFDTVVRVHRRGEGEPHTGLKPAGLSTGPVIPVAERAIESGSADELVRVLTSEVEDEVRSRFARVMELKRHADGSVNEAREYVESMLGLQVWAHSLHQAIRAEVHGDRTGHAH